jgi:hypothetical protein
VEVESVASLALARGEAEGFAWRVALLEVELGDSHQAQDTPEAKI